MATITKNGRTLRDTLNEHFLHHAHETPDYPYIGFSHLGELSLLARRAARYANMQEQACTYEWASGAAWDKKEQRLEQSIRELAETIPHINGVIFTGDPRGYTVRLILECGCGNTWGGPEDGFGIA